MEFFNIGFGELFFIILIALVILGPKEMTRAARALGLAVRKIVRSPIWSEIVTTSQQIRDLPNKIIREANLEETMEEVQKTVGELRGEIKDIDRETATWNGELQREIAAVEQKTRLEFQKTEAGAAPSVADLPPEGLPQLTSSPSSDAGDVPTETPQEK